MFKNLLSQTQSTIAQLEKEVDSKLFTSWALANKSFIVSAFYADEAALHSSGQRQFSKPYLQYFDLASLTKLLFTNALYRIAFDERESLFFEPVTSLLSPKSEVGEFLNKELQKTSSELRLIDFFNHQTGAPAWFWFGRGQWAFQSENMAKAQLMGKSSIQKCENCHHTLIKRSFDLFSKKRGTVYSDINYYLLARIFENLKSPQFTRWGDSLFQLNELWTTNFFHAAITPELTKKSIPYFPYIVSDNVEFQDERLLANFGPVHDTNASILASFDNPIVSGHAGLFGTALDVVKAIEWLCQSQTKLKINYESTIQNGRFYWGADTPTSSSSPTALEFPLENEVFAGGFLGYTGTMAWFRKDLKDNTSKSNVLLTNRTAQRVQFGVRESPRILNVVDRNTSESIYFKKTKNGDWLDISEEEAEDIIQFHSSKSKILWNTNNIQPPPNLLAIRQMVSKYNWHF